MFKANFFQTGLPYLIIAIVAMIVLSVTENILTNTGNTSSIVKISPPSGELTETVDNATPRISASNKFVTFLLEQITSNKLPIKEVFNTEPLLSLSPTEKLAVKSSSAYALSERHDFANTAKLLSELSFEQRIAQNVQFTFAHALSKTGNTAASIEQYKRYTAIKPNAFAAIFNHGLLLKKNQAYEQSITVLSNAVEKFSGHKKAKALASLADSEYQLSLYEDAIKHYKKSIEYRPDDPNTWAQLGNVLSISGAPYKQVLDTYNKAIALNQQDPRLHLTKARRQLQHYDYTGVSNTLKGTHLKSNNLTTRRLLAWSYLEQGKRNNAKKHIRYLVQHETSKSRKTSAELMLLYANKHYKELILAAKKHRRKSSEFRYLEALAYRKAGLYKSSMALLKDLSENKTYHLRSRIQIARIKRSRKQYNDAIADYQQLIEHNNTVAFLPFELSLTHESLAQSSAAIKSIQHALSINATNKTYQLANIRYLQLSGKQNKALQEINILLAKAPRYARGLKLKAKLQIARNEPDDATKTFEKILALQPSDTSTLRQLSELLIDRNRYKSAQNYLTKLLIERSDSVDARYLLAYSFYKNKQLTQALNELDNVLKLNKQHQLAKELKLIINTNFIS